MDGRRLIWIPPTDGDGNPVDARFETAAYQLARYVLRYRHDELPDEAVAASLLEEAVQRASRSARTHAVTNPRAYLLRAFKRLVDERIRVEWRTTPTDPTVLDQTITDGHGSEDIERAILLQEVYAQMDERTRQVVMAVVAGKTVEQIARDLQVTPNTVSQRLKNGYARLRKALHL
jgi:RNA polymerase sigma factor (sigma-70 family)